MKQILGIIVSDQSLSFLFGMKPYVITSDHPFFEGLKNALKTNDVEYIEKHIDIKQGIVNKSNGLLELVDGDVYYDGKIIHNVVTLKIQQMLAEGFDIQPMLNFLQNLLLNPSKTSVDELYLFLESGKLPITQDGHFLAYKKVRENYFDIHSGKFDNSVGKKPKMPRNQVDENRNKTCSDGLHFCSFDYLSSFGSNNPLTDRIMIVKINPKDVVTIPSDYNNTKGRACAYEVIGEVAREDAPNAFPTTVDRSWDYTFYEEEVENEDEYNENWNEETVIFTKQKLKNGGVIYRDSNGKFVSLTEINNHNNVEIIEYNN